MHKKGFCGIGIYHPQIESNLGTLFRSAYAFNVDFIFTIGRKYKKQCSDTSDSIKHIPYYHYLDKVSFLNNIPKGARLVLIEISEKAKLLPDFCHPLQAIYILGSEGGGLPQEWLKENLIIQIPTQICLNVATAGSIVLYDRISKINYNKL